MILHRLVFVSATLLGLVSSQQIENSTQIGNGANETESLLAVQNQTIVEAVNHLVRLNASYPVGRKINFSPYIAENATISSGAGTRVKFPPRAFLAATSHRLRNQSTLLFKKPANDLKNLHPHLARKLVNATRDGSGNNTRTLENRNDATTNELIGEKLARLEKMLVEHLLSAYNNITNEVKSQKIQREQKETNKQPFRIVVRPDSGSEEKEKTVIRTKIFKRPYNTTHVMRITKNNNNAEKTRNINEPEITQAFQEFGRKITEKRESGEKDLEATETSSRFKPPTTYQSGFRPIVRRDLSIVGPIPRGFSGMRSFDSTYDGIHSADIPPPIWPSPPFSMAMSSAPEQSPQPRVKVDDSPSLELLLYKYEEALKQYQEAVASYKKYYDKYLTRSEHIN